jgi:hypothetical protein
MNEKSKKEMGAFFYSLRCKKTGLCGTPLSLRPRPTGVAASHPSNPLRIACKDIGLLAFVYAKGF